MYFKIFLILLLWFGWLNLSIIILAVNLIINAFGKRFFAGFCSDFADKYNDIAESFKTELFTGLNNMRPGEKLRILEVGAGPGANFRFYNREAEVQAVEPNHHFEARFNENRAKFPQLDVKDVKIGFGEDLASAGVEDASCDAVVMTLVLCSVMDQVKCLEEIKRVLKPGGKFFYMEHIIDDDALLAMLQKLLTQCGFWPFAFDGCCVDRATDRTVEDAGFGEVDQKKYDLPAKPEDPMYRVIRPFIKSHVMGVATK